MASLCDLETGRRQVAEIRRLLAGRPGDVHLVGVAGIGMAGLAVHLAARGFRVTGCDLSPNRVSDALASCGVTVLAGHGPSHITSDIQWLVKSTAVPDDSAEILAAKTEACRSIRAARFSPLCWRAGPPSPSRARTARQRRPR